MTRNQNNGETPTSLSNVVHVPAFTAGCGTPGTSQPLAAWLRATAEQVEAEGHVIKSAVLVVSGHYLDSGTPYVDHSILGDAEAAVGLLERGKHNILVEEFPEG